MDDEVELSHRKETEGEKGVSVDRVRNTYNELVGPRRQHIWGA